MKIFIRIILSILTLIILALGIIAIIFMINKKNNKITYLFGYSTYMVSGKSMNPELEAGDLIFIKKQDSYEVGDTITFVNTTGDIVTHKIIDKVNGEYQTKGVNNNFIDGGYTKSKRVYGKVVGKIAGVGNFITNIFHYKNLILSGFIVILGALVITSIWRKNVR